MNVVQDTRTQPLQLDLLNQTFKVKTNWNVITGVPCAGKTTTLAALQELGYNWHPEIARNYIESLLERGHSLQEIRNDEGEFQRGLIDAKVALEASCDPKETIFFDRAMPDSVTYYRVAGLNPNEALVDCFNFQYARVFIFDPLPLQSDHARTENSLTIEFLNTWLERDYTTLGYNTIRVPVMPVQKRVEFVLQHINARV